jgi:exo-beta-1,3-glucanase (GH17 family)
MRTKGNSAQGSRHLRPGWTKTRVARAFIAILAALLFGCTLSPQANIISPQPQAASPTPALASPTAPPTAQPTQTQAASATPPITSNPTAASPVNWEQAFDKLVWVAYSPPSANPDKGIQPEVGAIKTDLATLRKAGFTGLITYSSAGVLGRELAALAQDAGFQGLIPGIWDPMSQEERENAAAAAASPLVLGYCVGNEGLEKRYQFNELSQAVADLKAATGKPVTTTEEIDDYLDPGLLALGDWVFPNAHPYFHNQIAPEMAARWTIAAYDDLARRAGRLVVFKEVGLPTAGGAEGALSEANQDTYYQSLEKSDVKFVYFEGFDQPWKTSLPIEPYWGIFRKDQTPKILALRLMKNVSSTPPAETDVFYVYRDFNYPANHFSPSGYMGDIGDIVVDDGYSLNPYSGKTAIKITYLAKGNGPNECPLMKPCMWAGIYWQEPPNNWGKDEFWSDSGYDLSGYTRLMFWARAEKDTLAEFKVGGILQTYGDSLEYPRSSINMITPEWQQFTIDLTGANLTHIIGGFAWVTNWQMNNGGSVIYLDEIRFEK